MKISIITASYNSEKTILDSLRSVQNQRNVEIEHILVDGDSTDKTTEIIKIFSKSNNIFVSEKDLGIYDAMNKGINLASGDIVGILNSDDIYYDDNVLSTISEAFNSNPDIDIVYGDLVYVEQYDLNKIVRTWKSKSFYNNFFEDANVPPHPSVFLRKEIYNKMGIFDLNFKLAADYEYLLRIFKSKQFKSLYIPQVFVKMRLGGATNKNFANIFSGNIEIINAWKKNGIKMPLYFFIFKLAKRIIQFF